MSQRGYYKTPSDAYGVVYDLRVEKHSFDSNTMISPQPSKWAQNLPCR